MDDIDALAAAAYEGGRDAVDVAVNRLATFIEVRDEVVQGRMGQPEAFPMFGSTDKEVVGRRMVAALLNAGWRAPDDSEVTSAAARSAEFTRRFDEWRDSLTPEQRERAFSHYADHGEFPPDLTPPK